MRFFNWVGQIFAVSAMNIRNIPTRLASSVVTILGIAGVVAVGVAVLSIASGFQKTLAGAGADDIVIVVRGGSQGEISSTVTANEIDVISEAPGIASGSAGPLVSPELNVVFNVAKASTGTDANVPVRGLDPVGFELRPRLKLTEGRLFNSGLNEIVVGRSAQRQFTNLDVGTVRRWGKRDWKVVGVFEDGGSIAESELLVDLRVLQDAYNRGSSTTSVRIQLESPDAFDTFKEALDNDARLEVNASTERDYYAAQSQALSTFIRIAGVATAIIMGLGAIFGAILTMYTAVSSRTREIATLRALGYGGGPIVISVFVEALVLGLLGGLIGAALAYVFFNGFQTSTLNFQSFTQVSFAFQVTPLLMGLGIAFALAMGFIGGLLPSVRAALIPITEALRAL